LETDAIPGQPQSDGGPPADASAGRVPSDGAPGEPSADATAGRLPIRQVLAVLVGNGLEFYDFVTYAFFAAQIGRTFFPSDTPGTSLLASLATFGAGFLTRPLGALVIGRLGDRVGRKPAMLLSFFLIGVGVIGLPLIPSYASIGVLAPLLAIAFRLVQGFALGGEVGWAMDKAMHVAGLRGDDVPGRGPNYGQVFEDHVEVYRWIRQGH